MQTQWGAWLAQLAADGMDARLPAIVRGQAYELVLQIPGDVSGETFAFTVSLSPGASVLETGTATAGSFADGVTPVTIGLSSTQSGDMPEDSDGDGLAEVVFELTMNGARISAGIIPISGEA